MHLCVFLHRLAEEKSTLLKQCEDTVSLKVEETEQLRLRLEEAQQELLLAKNQVWTGNVSAQCLCLNQQQRQCKINFFFFFFTFYTFQVSSVEQCLRVQEKLGAELQKEIQELSDREKEQGKINETKSEEIQRLEEELKVLQHQTEEQEKQLSDAGVQILSLEKTKTELENTAKETEVKTKQFICLVFKSNDVFVYKNKSYFFQRCFRRLRLRRMKVFWSKYLL